MHESGMEPYLARVRRKFPPSMGLYPPRTALWSSRQSGTSQRDKGFLVVGCGVNQIKLFSSLVSRSSGDMQQPLGPYFPELDCLKIRSPANQRSAGGGWDFQTVPGGIIPDGYVFVRRLSELHMSG